MLTAYLKYAEQNRLKSEILHSDEGHVIAKFCGKNVWSYFKYESGKHVVQREPPTENKGRRHTSLVVVGVLPLPPTCKEYQLQDSEVEVSTLRGSGPGGQHKNKTDSAVRMRHKKTGLQVFIDGRDQHANRRAAISILTARVNDHYNKLKQASYDSNRKKQLGDSGRGDKIRTYNFLDGRIVDHRLNTRTNNIKAVLKRGSFELILK